MAAQGKIEDDEILTAAQVSEFLKLHPRTIYKLAKKHILPERRVGRQWRFLRSEVITFLQKKRPGPFPSPNL